MHKVSLGYLVTLQGEKDLKGQEEAVGDHHEDAWPALPLPGDQGHQQPCEVMLLGCHLM